MGEYSFTFHNGLHWTLCFHTFRHIDDNLSLHGLYHANIHYDIDSIVRWLLHICVFHPYYIAPPPTFLVVLRPLLKGHPDGINHHDHMLAHSSILLGEAEE